MGFNSVFKGLKEIWLKCSCVLWGQVNSVMRDNILWSVWLELLINLTLSFLQTENLRNGELWNVIEADVFGQEKLRPQITVSYPRTQGQNFTLQKRLVLVLLFFPHISHSFSHFFVYYNEELSSSHASHLSLKIHVPLLHKFHRELFHFR